ncbi:MAG: protein kinase [Prevotella sp.]|nr:protein kinase [Prevotella sp.]
MNLPSNTLLHGGTYRIIRFINSGGFGCTYEAEHVMLQKRVAIKEFFVKDFCNRDETTSHVTVGTVSKKGLVEKLRKKFLDEARAICKLNHPGIVKVSDVFEDNGTAYFVMDYIDGQSLSDMLKRSGRMSEHQAVEYILQVADALKYVHSHNRLHLDVKPGNVMVDKQGKAILIDFGASKQYDEVNGENTSTLAGKTPGFAPPEQMGNDVVKFTPATDIYALGATLYKLLTGITPPSATLRISGEELDPLPEGISRDVVNAVNAALKMNKKERPQNIDEFLELLNVKDIEPEDDNTVVDPSKITVVKANPNSNSKTKQKAKAKTTKPVVKKNKSSKKINIFIAVACIAVVIAILKHNNADTISNEEETGNYVENQAEEYNGVEYTYTGNVNEKGLPDGDGKGVYPAGIYEGRYVNGSRDGKGKFNTSDGENTYEGTFIDDKYNTGILTSNSDGYYFKGSFVDDQPYEGTWYNKNGTVYARVKKGDVAAE